MISRSLLLFAPALLFLSSCKNDLQVNAPYKEFPSVYAILDPQEKIQMIRVNKVFLGESDANAMAQVADSVNYPAGDLKITLERFVNNQKTLASENGSSEIVFRDSVIETNPGAFSKTQRVYVTSEKLFRTGTYMLKVKNIKTNNEFIARSNSLDTVVVDFPPLTPPYYPVVATNSNQGNPAVYIDYSNPSKTFTIRYKPNDAILYQLTMRLHYYNVIGGNNEYTYVDYPFVVQNKSDAVPTSNLGAYLINSFTGSSLYSGVANSLAQNSRPVAEIEGRKMYKIEYLIISTTQDYLDYLQFSAPSLSINQEKPLYSNFEGKNALGLFTFRTHLSKVKEMDPAFITQFATNSNTCRYKFYTSANQLKTCP